MILSESIRAIEYIDTFSNANRKYKLFLYKIFEKYLLIITIVNIIRNFL
jgi:hypothetical protein